MQGRGQTAAPRHWRMGLNLRLAVIPSQFAPVSNSSLPRRAGSKWSHLRKKAQKLQWCASVFYALLGASLIRFSTDLARCQVYCLSIPPHASAKLFECTTGAKTTDEQRFVWNGADSSHNGTLALAAGQFRSGQCLGLVDPANNSTNDSEEQLVRP